MNITELLKTMSKKGDCKIYQGILYTPDITNYWFKSLISIPSRKRNYFVYQWSLVNGELFLNCLTKMDLDGISVYLLCESCADRGLLVKVNNNEPIHINLISKSYVNTVRKWYIENNTLYIRTKLF